jgi:lysophospholipase L1-like esterase
VALGDSFTSGAGLPRTTRDSGFCGRSQLSYPNLVAETLGATLEDVSCGGASTENGTLPQGAGAGARPPQLAAVTRDTDLVTVGLGGNDLSWYLAVMFGCTTAAAADPAGSPCEELDSSGQSVVTTMPPQIGDRLEALLDEVQRRAPDADVLLVGYPQPVPENGTCPELPLATDDYAFVREQWEALNDEMERAARDSGATFVEVLGPSEGHDICAGSKAWVNGASDQLGVAAAYHPFARGQRAVADLVLEALAR